MVNPTVDINLMCQSGHRYVESISGESTCAGTSFADPIDLGGPGDWTRFGYRGPGELHGQSFDFSYSFQGARIQVSGTFGDAQVSGHVAHQNPAACGRAELVQGFSLTWRDRG